VQVAIARLIFCDGPVMLIASAGAYVSSPAPLPQRKYQNVGQHNDEGATYFPGVGVHHSVSIARTTVVFPNSSSFRCLAAIPRSGGSWKPIFPAGTLQGG